MTATTSSAPTPAPERTRPGLALPSGRTWFDIAVLLVLVALKVVRLRIGRATLLPLLVLAVFQPVVYYVAETFGVMRTTASESGVITSAIPVAMFTEQKPP